MKSAVIRQKFYDFFVKNGHTKVPSSSLIPAQDPTLLFANAGMNQFKDLFLGLEKRSYTRAVTIQKCVRAGGKHNDLDNVGFTRRHLTFFEMMGNFSFGDYFKKEAIAYAWNFLTKELKLDDTHLYISIYKTDEESFAIWHKELGIPENKIYRLGEEENFWQMGETGPCGPCTEIHIDRGPEFGCKEQCDPACLCDRFLELWNLVFMQFDRQEDGALKPLAQTGVDTGMGIERIASVMQDVDNVFLTDLFTAIIKRTEELTGRQYAQQSDELKAAFHVLADHVRSTSLLIADGCAPSNEGRGYVLRKIIRRAALFAQKLAESDDSKIFPELSLTFIDSMKDVYPELEINRKLIYKILSSEIEKFSASLVRGQQVLDGYFKENAQDKIITGKQAFKLYDTYGFPLELVEIMAHENGYTVDTKGFEKEMQKQQEMSGKKLSDPLDTLDLDPSITTEFTGYDELETSSEIIALIDENNNAVQTIPKDKICWVITRKSPYFIVGGGQVPDHGWLVIGDHKVALNEVRYISNRIATRIIAPTQINVGDSIISIVHPEKRIDAMKNHTATHMLQSALIERLGKQIMQSGSLVHPDYLRFDFTYHANLTSEDIKAVEDRVNEKIRENVPVNIRYMGYKEAIDEGALAFFGDKYNPEEVRMVDIPDYSRELCGGTHVPRTGDIGVFKITDVTALSAGHRRIFAVTGPRALELFQETFDTVKKLGQDYKVKREEVVETVLKQKEQLKQTQSECKQLKKQMWRAQLPQWEGEVTEINGIPFLYLALEQMGHEDLKEIAQLLQGKKPGFYFITNDLGGKYTFLAVASPTVADRIDVKAFAAWAQKNHGLRGGGSKTSMQGGAASIDPQLKDAIAQWVAER